MDVHVPQVIYCQFSQLQNVWQFFFYSFQFLVALAIALLTLYLSQGASDYYSGIAEKQIALNLQLYGKTTVFYGGDKSGTESFKKMQEHYQALVETQKSVATRADSVPDGK